MSSISLYGISGWIIAGIGVCLIMIGIFARRIVIRTSPQCAKCGYPLGDVPMQNGLVVCPECGRSPVGATETYTMRRRRLPIALGIVLFLGALILPMVPTMRTQGWTASLPMSVQIRMWATGDNRLRQRVITAFRNDKIMGSKRELLRSKLMAAFNDPNTPKPIIESAIEYLRYTFTKNELLDEQDLASIASDETSNVRWLYMRYANQYTAPQITEMQEVRRSLALDSTNVPAQRSAIEWLVQFPSDDQADLDLLSSLIGSGSNIDFNLLSRAFTEASPLCVQVAIDLLADPSPAVRNRSLQTLKTYIRERDHGFSAEQAGHVLAVFDDPDRLVRWHAMIMVEDFGPDALPAIKELLLSVRDPELFSDLLYGIRRSHPEPVGLTPALAAISRDTTYPIGLRLDAVSAYHYVRARARPRVEDEPEELWAVYDDLVQQLIDDAPAATLVMGRRLQTGSIDYWILGSLGRRMLQEGLTTEQINPWLSARPTIEAILEQWVPNGKNTGDRYRTALVSLSQIPDNNIAKVLHEHSKLGLSMFYPDENKHSPMP